MRVVVRYHELALKGKNRPFFVRALAESLRRATADVSGVRVGVHENRLFLDTPAAVPWDLIRERVGNVLGVANFSPSIEVLPDMQALKQATIAALAGMGPASFRVSTKRSFKGFPLISTEVDRQLGGSIKAATGWRVDLNGPELTVFVEVLRDRIYVSLQKLPGPGGFPVGTAGRVVALLSGGIDSPVAAWRMMKRGCTVVPVHLHAFPLLDHTTIDKARDLARILARFQFRVRLLLAPFGPVQQTIVASCPEPLRVVLYRRFMVRIAEELARRHRAKALVTGESLGQVASQTLDNMTVIDEAARGPVLRPLVGMDKDEIVAQAKRIGTFETSTLPDQDCCQLFVPRHPATAAHIDEVRKAEEALDVAGLVRRCVSDTEAEIFEFPVAPSTSGSKPAAQAG
jgi:thiamine biosynthesis protein ThiI